jgi:hypothetical protein
MAVRFFKLSMNQTPVHKIAKIHRNQFLSFGWKTSLITDVEVNIPLRWNTTLHQEDNRIPTPLENLVRSRNNGQGHWKYGQHIPTETPGPIRPRVVDILSNTDVKAKTRNDKLTPPPPEQSGSKNYAWRYRHRLSQQLIFPGTLLEISASATLLCKPLNLLPDCGRCSGSVTSAHSEGQGSRHPITTLRSLRRKSAMCNSDCSL